MAANFHSIIMHTEKANTLQSCTAITYTSLPSLLLYSLRNVPDHENPGVYVYTFTPCSPFDCGSYGDPSGFVRMLHCTVNQSSCSDVCLTGSKKKL